MRVRNVIAALVVSVGLAGGTNAQAPAKSAPSPKTAAPQPVALTAPPTTLAVPPPEALIILIRSSLLALAHANETGNYTVLRDLAAPDFQAANSAAKLAIIFTDLRQRNLDLRIAALLTPQVAETPVVNQQSLLVINGFFPTQPQQLTFGLVFQAVQNNWRLFGINVQTPPQSPAPSGAVPPAPTVAAPKAK